MRSNLTDTNSCRQFQTTEMSRTNTAIFLHTNTSGDNLQFKFLQLAFLHTYIHIMQLALLRVFQKIMEML